MKRFTLVAMSIVAAFLAGCAADGTQNQGNSVASHGDAPIGSLIKSRTPSAQNSGQADMQALENARIQNNGVMNLPQR